MIKINKNTIHTNNNTNTQNIKEQIRICKPSRIKDWTKYNQSLINRANVSLLVSPAIFLPPKQAKRAGRKQEYSDALILFLAAFREIIQQPFRQTIGHARNLAALQGIKLPSYNRLCVRMQQLKIEQKLDHRHFKKVCLLVDSTGLKTKGEGEWKVRKHGAGYRRGWVKLHLSVDYKTQTILSHVETPENVGDQAIATQLVDEANVDIQQVVGDGLYGSHELYQEIEGERGISLLSPPHKNARLHVKQPAINPGRGGTGGKYTDLVNEEGWETHNKYLRDCMHLGWDGWKDKTGYHKRSLVETTMWRFKSAFSDKLKSTSSRNQSIEIALRVMLLNQWTIQNQDNYKKSLNHKNTKT